MTLVAPTGAHFGLLTAGIPATPTISASNNDDGTATVTISGSDAGTTNTVYTASFNGTAGALGSWTSGGSRSGDGTVDVTLDNGLYLFRVTSSNGTNEAESNIVYLRVSDGTDSLWTQCVDAVRTKVASLSLSGISGSNIVKRTAPEARRDEALPRVVICPWNQEAGGDDAGTNIHDERGYPVMVAILESGNRDATNTTKRDAMLLWREQIDKAFRNQRLTGVPAVHKVNVEFLAMADANVWFDHNLFAGGMVLRCQTRSQRGVA